jgi:hypothetical protein
VIGTQIFKVMGSWEVLGNMLVQSPNATSFVIQSRASFSVNGSGAVSFATPVINYGNIFSIFQ